MKDSLKSFLDAWPSLISIAESHRGELPNDIYRLITDISLKRSVEDYCAILDPVSKALNQMQASGKNLSDAVLFWHELAEELSQVLTTEKRKYVVQRRNQAITPAHLLSFYIDPRFHSQRVLTQDEINTTMVFAQQLHSELPGLIARFRAKCPPFIESFFSSNVATAVHPAEWWNLPEFELNAQLKEVVVSLLSCSPTTADIERLFSTFGWIHSKERNRLGIEKASKLVFCLKVLNSS